MPTTGLTVAVIGAGTGGMCLAHGLRRAGIDVTVYERDRTRTGGLNGYRVGISPNGARALKACLAPDLFDTFVATTAAPYDHLMMYTERFRELVSLPYADLPRGGDRPEDRDHNVSRMTLRQVLLTGMEEVVVFDKTFTHYRQNADGTVTAHFADGDTATAELLVGADGANSRMRRQYLPHAGHTETGLVAIGGKAALSDVDAGLLPPEAMAGMSMLFDRRGQMGVVHSMRLPWKDGAPRTGIGADDAALITAWPGLRYDNTTDYLSWGLSTSRSLAPVDVLDRTGKDLHDVALELTADWDPRWHALVTASDPSAALALSIRTSDPVPPWRPSTVTLLGDAIHTMTPGRGAGANTALRDARELRDRLVQARDGHLSVTEAVGSYEELMRRYSALAVRESLEFMNDNGTARRPVVGPLSVFAQRTAMRLLNRVPRARRRMARSLQKVRDSELV
jgi:2-polyprenyl-6-methoxyphenol hydroxylase-like FAD-dependent oxidoreductase